MSEIKPVTPAVSSAPAKVARGLFGTAHCEQIDLRYRVTRDTFDVPRFLAFFKEERAERSPGKFVVCRTLEPEKLDYHIHFSWNFSKDALIFYVSFHSGVLDKYENEHEPYAEQFMPWFGGFFSNDSAHADLHSEFEYPAEARQSRFPLPLKVNISDDLEAEIDGMFMSFASMPDAMSGARIKQGKKRLTVELSGAARTNFANFNLQSEVHRLSSFALRLTDTKDIK